MNNVKIDPKFEMGSTYRHTEHHDIFKPTFLFEEEEADDRIVLKVTSQRNASLYCHLLFLCNLECLILRRPKIHRMNKY